MTYDRPTAGTLAILRKLPVHLSTASVAQAYHIDPAVVERERPKGNAKGRPASYKADDGIPADSSHRIEMEQGSAAMMDRFRQFHPERFR